MAGGLNILGTSGQNVEDVKRNTDLQDPLETMEHILNWGHLAPTCPDTLGCYPYQDRDPFVIERKPHVFFAANQEKFGAKVLQHQDGAKTLLISVPKLSSSKQICLVNLKQLSGEILEFTAEC